MSVCSDLLLGALLFEGDVLDEGGSTLLEIILWVRQKLHGLLQRQVRHGGCTILPAERQRAVIGVDSARCRVPLHGKDKKKEPTAPAAQSSMS